MGQNELQTGLRLWGNVSVTAGDPESFDLGALRTEGRDAFYAALGRRLILLRAQPPETTAIVIATFLDQCFRLGPKGIDAAVFTAALQHEVRPAPSRESAAYRQR